MLEGLTRKRWGNGRFSITDVISFLSLVFFAIAVNNAHNGIHPLSWFNVFIDVDKMFWIFFVLFVVNGMSALNVMEDVINTIFRTVGVPILLIWAVGGDFSAGTEKMKGFVNSPSSNGNNYMQTPQNLPVIVPQRQAPTTTPHNNQANADATKWNRIGINQKLRRSNKLTPQGLQWCKTSDANKTNQGRLHCKTGFTWTKNGWSNKNDTL